MPKPPHKKNFKTLLLDLDETLVHYIDYVDSASCINSIHEIYLSPSPEAKEIRISLSLRPGL